MSDKLFIEDICRKLKPIFGKKIDEIYLRYSIAETREEKEEIISVLNLLYKKHLGELLDRNILLEPPKAEIIKGDYNLATVSYSGKRLYPFGLREKDWPRHVCISGMSGSGKTTFAFSILDSLIKHNKSFLVFDWKKSFRPLCKAAPDVMCFTIGNNSVSNLFRVNINKPPRGINAKEWINVLCDLLVEGFAVSYGVHKVLLETLDKSFKAWGVYEGSENYPTWHHIKYDLENALSKAKGRESGWVESALRIATVLTFGNFGDICNSKEEGLSIEDILDKKVILELNALSNIEKKFFCEYVLTYIYKFKKANQKTIEGKFDYAVLVDEAHNIFLKRPTSFAQESVTDMIYREMREYGTSLICLDQHISKLSDSIKGNSACVVAFQQQLPQDISDISSLMQISEDKNYFSMLNVGNAIVKLSERYTSPFLIETPLLDIVKENISDRYVRERVELLLNTRGFLGNSNREKLEDFKKNVPEVNMELSRDGQEISSNVVSTNQVNPLSGNVNNCEDDNQIFTNEMVQKKINEVNELINKRYGKDIVNKEDKNDVENKINVDSCEDKLNSNISHQKTSKEYFEEKERELADVELNSKKRKRLQNGESFDAVQQVLYDFVSKKLNEGRSLKELERMLEENKEEGGYSLSDIGVVINFALKEKFNTDADLQIQENKNNIEKKIYKGDIPISNSLTDEQKMFLSFLQNNPNIDYGVTVIYKHLGLSSRKGNEVKNQLLQQNLIKVEEIRSNKGWKKVIRLS